MNPAPPDACHAVLSDPISVAELAAAILRLQSFLPTPVGDDDQVSAYAAKLRSLGWLATVRDGDRVMALVAMYANDPVSRQAFISILAVDPAIGRRGWGRWLLSEAMAEARRCGMHSVALKVLPSNTPAVRLYEGMGFRATGSVDIRTWMEAPL